MITVFLRGGLGNQMFQYAFGLALAKKNGSKLVLDTTHLADRTPRRNFSYRDYELGIFALEPEFTRLSKIAAAAPVPALWLGLDLAGMKARELVRLQNIIREKSEQFDPAVLEEKGNLLLFGRWQSERYFSDAADEVREHFRFRGELPADAQALAEEMASSRSVSLHVRRGDYAAFGNVASMMGQTNLDYYRKAAAHIAGKIDAPQFFVFSDDIIWCKTNLKIDYPAVFMPPQKGPLDLRLMSLCKHNIIANSTFSWWGAWLNANPDKIVIAPKRWYADGRPEPDIIPANWIRI